MALDDRHKAFIDQYMIDQNGTQAALRANLSANKRSAASLAWSYLQRLEVREEIDRRIAERRAKNKLTIEMIEGWLRDFSEADVADLYDDEGNLRPLSEWPTHVRKAVQSIETAEHPINGIINMKVKLVDKKGSIELLGKYKKMFTDKLELQADVRQKVSFTITGVKKNE